jgi:hypothetical protein
MISINPETQLINIYAELSAPQSITSAESVPRRLLAYHPKNRPSLTHLVRAQFAHPPPSQKTLRLMSAMLQLSHDIKGRNTAVPVPSLILYPPKLAGELRDNVRAGCCVRCGPLGWIMIKFSWKEVCCVTQRRLDMVNDRVSSFDN